jgi:hypothetical protein
MILIIVVELDVIGLLASIQRTTVPFKLMLVELIVNVETRDACCMSRDS